MFKVTVKGPTPGAIERALTDAVRQEERRVEDEVRRVSCPVHYKRAQVSTRRVGSKTELSVTGACCDRLTQAIEAKVKHRR